MAVTKIWAVKNRLHQLVDYVVNKDKTTTPPMGEMSDAVKDLLDYDENEYKTENHLFVSTVGCNPDNALEVMKNTLRLNDSQSDTVAYHMYQSFKPGECRQQSRQALTADTAHQIGIELARELFGDFPVVVATHLDRSHLHNHLAICATSFTGKRFHDCNEMYRKIRDTSDRLCREYGLSVIEQPKRGNKRHIGEIKAEEEGRITARGQIRADIDMAIANNITWKLWWRTIESYGYTLEYRGKYLRIRPDKSKKFFRLDKLGEGYTEADVSSRLRYRFNRAKAAEYSPFVPPKRDKPQGLHALYLYYCYLLGELPKTKPENREAYDCMKEDRKYLNRISEEAKLLGKYHIDTAEQLSSYTASKSAEFKSLAIERKKLRNKLGRMHDTEAMQPIKEQISVLSDQMSTIRKEMKLCEDVAERSGVIEAVVNTIFDPRQAEKTKQTEKEREKGEERK